MSRLVKILPNDVLVRDRHRSDFGDVDDLAQSILSVGLLQPIVLDNDRRLVAGARRLAAWRSLHGDAAKIEAVVVDTVDSARLLLLAERDENICRLEMSVAEKLSLAEALEAIEAKAAKERMAAGGRGGKLPPLEAGKTRDKVGESVGLSGRTLDKAKAIKRDAEDASLPDEVREVAKQSLANLSIPGAKVDREFRAIVMAKDEAFDRQVSDISQGSDAVRQANYHAAGTKAASAMATLLLIDAESFGATIDEAHLSDLEFEIARLNEWLQTVRNSRGTLKVVDNA